MQCFREFCELSQQIIAPAEGPVGIPDLQPLSESTGDPWDLQLASEVGAGL